MSDVSTTANPSGRSLRLSPATERAEPSTPVLLFDRVSKWYGPVIGVNQVTLELRPGITGLVGANGAGKSTLLRLATGHLKPTIGRVLVRGLDAWSWRAKRRVGYCPDHDAFYEDMSGREFVRTMAGLCGYSRSEASARTEDVLRRVGMTDRATRRIAGYSKGMRQRIKLAQALLHDPDLLVLDEPLSGIDPIGRRELLTLFDTLAEQGKCLLVSSHELEALEQLTEQVAIMARGRIAAVGSVQQIRELIDDQPFTIRIDVDRPRDLSRCLLDFDGVVGLDLEAQPGAVLVRARHPREFFARLQRLTVEEEIEISHLEALDESTHAVLGYLLGGSGKT